MKPYNVTRIVLVVLLLLSLLGNAVAIGFFMRLGRLRSEIGFTEALDVQVLSRNLGSLLHRELERDPEAMRTAIAQLQARRRKMLAALETTPFDRTEIERQMALVRDATTEVQQAAQQLILRALERARRP